MIDRLCARLVGDWRNFMRWWSVRMMLIGGLLGTMMTLMPSLPPEVQAAIPVSYRVIAVAAWSVASVFARVLQQKPPGA